MMNEEIKNKLQRGLALTVKESWDLYKYIEALEQQTCEDCISRQAVIRLVEQHPNIIGNRYSGLIANIKHLPSAIPMRDSVSQDRVELLQELQHLRTENEYLRGKLDQIGGWL